MHLVSFGQIPSRTWRDHLSYTHATRLAEVDNKIYCATEGGLFSYNKSDNSIQKYSKVNGLSDIGISTMGYSETYHSLVVCYSNGNIDIIRVKADSVINVSDIKRKLILGDKSIYNIFFYNQYAYLSCGFGIVLLDLQKSEIKDTYQFGDLGNQIGVNAVAVMNQNIYATTNQGIYKADINSPNLVDYTYWERLSNVPEIGAEYKSVAFYAGKLLAYYYNSVTGFDEIIEFDDSNWSVWSNYSPDYFRTIHVSNNYLIVISTYRTQVYDTLNNPVAGAGTIYPQYAIYDRDHILWIADPETGLRRLDQWLTDGDAPNGPKYNDVGELQYLNGRLWVAAGNLSNQWNSKGAYLFKNEIWESYNDENYPVLEPFLNISEIAIDPGNPDHIYGGSYGYGVIEMNTQGNLTIYDEEDGVLQPIEGFGHGFIRITGMSYDTKGNLWMCASLDNNPVYVVRPDGTWENIELDYDGFGINTSLSDIITTSYGDIWLLIEGSGILAIRENGNGTISEKFFTVKDQDGNLFDRIYSAAEDIDGNIWVGTDEGPVEYYRPSDVFNGDAINGYQVVIPRNDGTNLGDFLLKNDKINCIVVDGANRKWFGTEKSGAFLTSADGKEELHHFTAENSPLFADNVVSIAINDETGEVFFGTEKGILSYKGEATKGNEDFKNAYVYPNPVRENYTGDIVITGLVADANVKITDVSGNLVYETKALGGQALWDGKNFRGEKVHTGVYLIFCTNDDGSKTFVTKLLFIH